MTILVSEKACYHCKLTFPASDFFQKRQMYKGRQCGDGLGSMCKGCTKIVKRKHYATTKGRATARRGYLRYYYGISLEAVNEMLLIQGGLCKICKRPPGKESKHILHVDHNHKTGVVRGLLCQPCNTVLGKMNDDPALLRKAADYIESGV